MAIQVIPATHKEVHLLSEPSELQSPDASEVYLLPRSLKTMAHRYRHTEKEAHLLSGPSELQPPDDSEVQHRSSNQDKNTADSQKQKKLSFKPHLFIMMIETLSGTILLRNFHLTLSTRENQILPLSLILYFRRREEIAEDIPAPAEDVPAPIPTPAPTLETVRKRPHTPGTRKSTRNFGKPASAYSDSYIQALSRPGSVDTQYNVELYEQLYISLFTFSLTMDTHI